MLYSVTVKPGSKKGPLVVCDAPAALTVYLRAKPIDGAANEALITTLADHFRVPKTRITIKRGHHARQKLIDIPTEEC